MSDSLIADILATIEPANQHLGARVYDLFAAQGITAMDDMAELAARLAAATHTLDVRLEHKHVVVCAADHGVDSATGRTPEERAAATWAALDEVAQGRAAVCAIARSASAGLILVECGIATDRTRPPGVLELTVGPGTADICRGPAMTRAAAETAVRTGIALLLSLAQSGCDCIALGQLASGSHAVATAMIAHLTDMAPTELEPKARDIVARALAANPLEHANPFDILAALGGYDIGVLCGLVLGAASLRIPVVLDDRGTSAAALLCARMAPASTGYLIASHAGTSAAHKRALDHLGLAAIFDMAISHGEGAGSAAAMAIVATAAQLLHDHVGR